MVLKRVAANVLCRYAGLLRSAAAREQRYGRAGAQGEARKSKGLHLVVPPEAPGPQLRYSLRPGRHPIGGRHLIARLTSCDVQDRDDSLADYLEEAPSPLPAGAPIGPPDVQPGEAPIEKDE